jgi:site-specific DNA-methyltransferase (adenine-specific)
MGVGEKTKCVGTVDYGDSGGASRFFYCPKTSPEERGKGNDHPTVKPIRLLTYLCKLTSTPTGGVVLDPFMGSGSTGLACLDTGRDFVGIEIDPHYVEIAKRRYAERRGLDKAQKAL